MMQEIDFSKQPTPQLIKKITDNYKKQEIGDEVYAKVLEIVQAHKTNHKNLAFLITKVKLVNAVFNTSILSAENYARFIFNNVKEIDKRLLSGDKRLIKDVARFETNNSEGRIINNYSFATKFCHLHQPELFPIYDSRITTSLLNYQKNFPDKIHPQFSKIELRDYKTFCNVFNGFKAFANVINLKNQVVDRFLWLGGKK